MDHHKFSIIDLPADPESLLAGIFEYCIDDAIECCQERMGEKPDHVGCVVNSPLLDTPIYTPIRHVNTDVTSAILNFFLKVAQSKKQDGITLWVSLPNLIIKKRKANFQGAPFEVAVTTVNRAQLPNENQIVGGANPEKAIIHHRICDKSLIKVDSLITFRSTNNFFFVFRSIIQMDDVCSMP